MIKYVLYNGVDYFAYWTVTGPKFTHKLFEAQTFDFHHEAQQEAEAHWELKPFYAYEVEYIDGNR